MKSIRSNARRLMLAGGLVLMLPLTASAACPPDDEPDGDPSGRHHGAGGPPPIPGNPGAYEEGPLPHLRGLNLSQAQRDRIFAVLQAQAPAMRAKSREAREALAELHEMAMSTEYDEVMANWLAAVQAKALTELALLRARADHDIHQVLTPEQRKALGELKRRFEPRGTSERRGPPLPPNGCRDPSSPAKTPAAEAGGMGVGSTPVPGHC
jgi:Spy/CpxP family protein refolding chaperone